MCLEFLKVFGYELSVIDRDRHGFRVESPPIGSRKVDGVLQVIQLCASSKPLKGIGKFHMEGIGYHLPDGAVLVLQPLKPNKEFVPRDTNHATFVRDSTVAVYRETGKPITVIESERDEFAFVVS